ncbi:S-layer homology domain-containing protein [Paenibacillus crassostreae]|uniref:SLH domain-containing protein n=1 Tax=Paenibacillus crassostreae TaxID=1763538 RepID=A0A167D7X8_9BACL|nr:S-layer homology domain-containing protein [Paenibacillus crassostreae]AOZ93223.1 hypothetical protein LPB68_14065 [Paenibacillus crassostreae]OAB74046.1 hypothetical protein PNBC_12905 [Paenibacillus crassostreae]
MSNTSPLNENKNNNVMYAQGGEKKVMKKILSVALSTAMAFSMFASVAFADTAVSTQDKYDALKAKGIFSGYPDGTAGLENEMTRAEFAKVLTKVMGLKEVTDVHSYNDAGYDNAKNWAAPYIEAVTAAGVMQGQDLTKKLFNQKANVTVQELAEVLVKALDLEVPTTTDNTATEWAKGSVQAAINAGLLSKDLNFQANAKRSLLVESAFLAEAKLNPVAPIGATKVETASANNYKEVTVAFDGAVDKASATNPNNYTITGLSFDGATLSEDAKSVKLRIAQTSGILDRQKDYTLNVKGVKASDLSKTISQEVKFSPVDVTLPEVKEVVGLGTKAFKVVFSEPVQQSSVVSTANFKIDGKAVSGYVKYTYPNVAIVSTTLEIGAHTLSVSNVEDYAGFKVAPVTKDFTVAEDKEAPEITGIVTDDLSRVEITFNETVKSVSKIYQTSSGRTATYKIEDNKVIATFTGDHKLSLAETTIYVEGVTDYSDNSANRSAKVTPVLDVIRPEVVGVTAEVYKNSQEFTVEFTEAVLVTDATNTANYTLKDKDGKVVKIKGFNQDGHPVTKPVVVSTSQGKQVKFSTLGLLDTGVYTVEVANVRDQSALGNVMLPYSTTINLGDVAKPTILGTSYYEVTHPGNDRNVAGVDITVNFSKAIALDGTGTALDANKYNYSLGSSATAATYLPLPTKATVTAINADTIRISLPAKDGGYLDASGILNLRAVNVADTNGNYIAGNLATVALNEKSVKVVSLKSAKATSNDTIVAEFDGNLAYVDNNDFEVTVTGGTYSVKEASIDGAKVTFKLANDKKFAANVGAVTLNVKAAPYAVQSVNANGLKAFGTKTITDSVSPTYVDNSVLVTNAAAANQYTATLTFDEALVVFENPTAFTVKIGGNDATVKTVVRDADTTKVVVTFEYTGTVTGEAFEIYLNSDNTSSKFITDTLGNAANVFSEYKESL